MLNDNKADQEEAKNNKLACLNNEAYEAKEAIEIMDTKNIEAKENAGTKKTIGIMLMAFGGPDSLDSVEPFMEKLMKGRKPSPEIIQRAKEKYRLIGGKSPLPDITKLQAHALERKLNEQHGDLASFKTYVGMRYWHPSIEEALLQMAKDGVKQAYAISMSPHSSTVSTKAYEDEIKNVLREKNLDLKVKILDGMYKHPLFIEAITQKILEALKRFPAEKQHEVQLIFSAHSLPISYIENGDPYVDELKVTIKEVLSKLPAIEWRLAYQSKGTIPGEWLKPMIEETFQEILKKQRKYVLVVPVGFAADHVETLWDLDILHKKQALDLGLVYERSGALNDSPLFIDAMASMVIECLKK